MNTLHELLIVLRKRQAHRTQRRLPDEVLTLPKLITILQEEENKTSVVKDPVNLAKYELMKLT